MQRLFLPRLRGFARRVPLRRNSQSLLPEQEFRLSSGLFAFTAGSVFLQIRRLTVYQCGGIADGAGHHSTNPLTNRRDDLSR
jgi:hypothetical protein